MVFKTTSTKPAAARRRGMTLVEVLMAMGLGSIALIVIASLVFFTARSFAAMTNYVDLENSSRNALDRMTREIRQVTSLTQHDANRLVFLDFDSQPLEYVYSPGARTLTRIKGPDRDVILEECDVFRISIFQRNPVGGTYDQYPTAVPANCKLIQLSWVCSRTIFGERANTESVQTAKIVIRNQ